MKPLLAVLIPVMALCAVFAAFHLGAQPAMPAAIVNQQLSTFGMVGLANGQTARLNAFALPMGSSVFMGGPVTGTPVLAGACQVTFTFYDDSGSSLLSKTLSVSSGAAVHLDLPRTKVTAAPDPQEIRGAVRTTFSTPSATPITMPIAAYCSVVPTMEIYNSSGQVTAVLELSHPLPSVMPM